MLSNQKENWLVSEYTCYKTLKKFYEGSTLPPIRGALKFHFKPAFHQLRIWVTEDKAQLNESVTNLYGLTL